MSHARQTIDLADEFPLEDSLIYMNHAAVGPWPRRTVEAIDAFARENLHRAIGNYHFWTEAESLLRERLARWLNAPDPQSIALQKNTSEGLSTIAFGLPWEEGDNVVLPDEEFPSNKAPWEHLARRGVELRLVDTRGEPRPEARLLDACDDRTRLVTTSSVQFATGVRTDLEGLGPACRERGILLCVDAIQSFGVVPLDVEAMAVDFVAGGCHKWLLAPEGVGYLYCRPELMETIEPLSRGWRMGETPFGFENPPWGPASNARRFECGTLNTLGMIAVNASMSLLEDLGLDLVAAAVAERSARLVEGLAKVPGLRLATPLEPERRAGIVAFETADTRASYRALRAGGVLPALREGLVRLSPHFYTPLDQIEEVIKIVETSVGAASAANRR